MVVCVILYLYYAHAHQPLKLKALQAQKRLCRVKTVTRRLSNSTSLKLAKRIGSALKVAGVRAFTYEELVQATDNFSEENQIGQGGYGTVFKGKLRDGKQVAIKRAGPGSGQGAPEFYNEIELLSRVHHKNLVMLEGYCDEESHQMLVYEFMPGGTLRDRLFQGAGPLDFPTRLRIALGAGRGILYLHTEANPPIFHRDIKASNILLDNRMVAKVADFGLSCLAPVPDMESGVTPNHVSTVVKGTPGYLDPEYYMTQQLTDKSDVYSFGVVMLELITGRRAIAEGKNIVREAYKEVEGGNLLSMVDPNIAQNATVEPLERFMELALSCCRELQENRPTMREVVSELEQLGRYTFSTDQISKPMKLQPSKPQRQSRGSKLPSELSPDSDGGGVWSDSMMHVSPR